MQCLEDQQSHALWQHSGPWPTLFASHWPLSLLQVPAPSCWADGMAPEKVMKALEDLQTNAPNTDAEAMRFAISVSELQPDTGEWGLVM